MKKILFVCDGGNFSNGAFEFIKMLNDYEPVSVKGLFFEPIDFQQLVSVGYIPIAKPYDELKTNEQKVVSESKCRFENLCRNSNILYSIDEENDEWIADLFARETRFADLAIMSEELFCSDISSDQPNVYMQEALHISECPVILVPENFKIMDRVVVAYDGNVESMFALKQFCHLLPELFEKPVELVYTKNEDNENIPCLNLLKEYSRNHFNNLAISKLHFDGHKYFLTWCEEKKNSLLVAGSYGRTMMSNFLRKSFSEQIIHEHKMPVFLAHP